MDYSRFISVKKIGLFSVAVNMLMEISIDTSILLVVYEYGILVVHITSFVSYLFSAVNLIF